MNLSDHDAHRFWSKVRIGKPDTCWPWTAGKNSCGHGEFHIYHGATDRRPSDPGNTTSHKAHRIAYALSTGEYPGGDLVIHLCRDLSCCNPAHLSRGSIQDVGWLNARLKRIPPQVGHLNHNAKISSAQALEIKARISAGESNVSIAADYPISHSMVSKIRKGHAW